MSTQKVECRGKEGLKKDLERPPGLNQGTAETPLQMKGVPQVSGEGGCVPAETDQPLSPKGSRVV